MPLTSFDWWASCSFSQIEKTWLLWCLHALVTPRSDNYNTLYTSCPWIVFRNCNGCRMLQPECWLKWVLGTKSFQSWPNVFLGTIQGALLTFKALHGLSPAYVKDCLLLMCNCYDQFRRDSAVLFCYYLPPMLWILFYFIWNSLRDPFFLPCF